MYHTSTKTYMIVMKLEKRSSAINCKKVIATASVGLAFDLKTFLFECIFM